MRDTYLQNFNSKACKLKFSHYSSSPILLTQSCIFYRPLRDPFHNILSVVSLSIILSEFGTFSYKILTLKSMRIRIHTLVLRKCCLS